MKEEMSDDEEPTFVEVSILCDRCEDLLAATAETYPVAQYALMDIARKLGWYVAERASTNGSTLTNHPRCDLCAKCYRAWISSGQKP